MSRIYAISFSNVSVAAVQDLIGVYAGANMGFLVHEVVIGQTTATAVGNLRISCKRLPATVTSGTGGAAATPAPINPSDAAATVTARTNDTTQATTSGSSVTVRSDIYNVVNTFQFLPPPEDRPLIKPGQAFVVSLDTAPGSAQMTSGTIVIEEIL